MSLRPLISSPNLLNKLDLNLDLNPARASHFSLKVEEGKNSQPLSMHYTSTEASSYLSYVRLSKYIQGYSSAVLTFSKCMTGYFLTFNLRGLYLVFAFTVLSFPLNRCACLTISVLYLVNRA